MRTVRGVPARPQGSTGLLASAREVAEEARRLRMESAALHSGRATVQGSASSFAELYDFVPIPYLMTSDLGVIVEVNDCALDLLGGLREWVQGRPLIAYVEQADMRKVLHALAASSQAFTQSLEVRVRARGGIRTVQMTTRRAFVPGSRSSYHVALVDLTARRQLEEDRRRAEDERRRSLEAERVALAASAAKDEFLAMLSHELRTPLTPILAACDSLTSHDSLPSQVRDRIEIIRRNVKAETRLIDDLLDLARITQRTLEVRPAPSDLHRVIGEVADAWTGPLADKAIHLEYRLDAAAHWVNGDAGRLAQVIRNVVSNAAKFTDPGGRIDIRTDNPRDGSVRVVISDTGVGMSQDEIERLFTPFVRAKQTSARRGLGLGLAISKAIVEAHAGELDVTSGGPQSGTTVHLAFPTIPAPVAERPRPVAAPSPAPSAPGPILLVEDDADSSEMLALLLSSEGFEVRVAQSIHAARLLADACAVIVSDISLPDGNGLDLMTEIRARRPVRGIALSGYGSSDDVQRSLKAGFEAHLTKPVDLARLVAAIRRLTGRGR